jgi:hypothetical protein
MAWEWARQGASHPLPTGCPQPNHRLQATAAQRPLRSYLGLPLPCFFPGAR